jgi:hypothetical protein
MIIKITIINNNDEDICCASALTIDDAICELGSIERYLDKINKCKYCGEPTNEERFCSAKCEEAQGLSGIEKLDDDVTYF